MLLLNYLRTKPPFLKRAKKTDVPVSAVKETLLCFTVKGALLEPSFQARKDVN